MSIRHNNKTIAGGYSPTSYRYVGEIFQSALPITDPKVHALDGSKITITEGYAQFIQHLNNLVLTYPQLACTEEEWQTAKTMSAFGQVGKFVLNYSGDEIISVRLPRVVNVQGLFDLQNLGMTVDAGLPNIDGYTHLLGAANTGLYMSKYDGAMYPSQGNASPGNHLSSSSGGNPPGQLNFDASRSNPIYGNSDTVQQEAIQYPYYIVLATGVVQNITYYEDLKVNNTNSYGDSKYVGDMTLNNLSWLKSEGQTNSGTIYTGFYNWAVANIGQPFGAGYITGPKMYGYSKGTDYHYTTINEVPKVGDPVYGAVTGGFIANIESVDTANASITFHNPLQQNESVTASRDTKYDIPTTNPYFLIVDQANQTFILPTLNGSEDLPSDKYDNLTLGASGEIYVAPANGWYVLDKSSSASGQFSRGATSTGLKVETGSTFSTQAAGAPIWVKRGDKATITYNLAGTLHSFIFVYAKGNGNLYYYVGDILKNSDLVNIARLGEQLSNKVDSNFANVNTTGKEYIAHMLMPSDKYIDLTLNATGSSYTAPADGLVLLTVHPNPAGTASFCEIEQGSLPVYNCNNAPSNVGADHFSVLAPVKKGTFKAWYRNARKVHFRFFYTIGSEPTA